ASGVVLYTSPNAVSSCRKSVWDFENPDTSLIGIDGWGNSNETLIRRLNMPNSGNWSAGLYSSDLDMYPAYTDYYFREPPNNDLGYVDVRGKTFSAYVYVAAQTPVATDYCRLQGSTSTAPYEYFFAQSTATKMQPPANQWFELKGTFASTTDRNKDAAASQSVVRAQRDVRHHQHGDADPRHVDHVQAPHQLGERREQ